MAHRKNPSALRGNKQKLSTFFSIYTRNNTFLYSWTNRLKRVQRLNSFSKCTLKKKTSGYLAKKKKKDVNKNILKLTHAVVYSSHFSNTVYPFFSKGFIFKTKKNFRKK